MHFHFLLAQIPGLIFCIVFHDVAYTSHLQLFVTFVHYVAQTLQGEWNFCMVG